MEKVFAEIPWQWDTRIGAWRTDARFYSQVAPLLNRFVPPIADDVPQWQPVRWPKITLPQPRPEQTAAIDAWLAVGRGCVVMPTGTGKTEVALSIMARRPVSTLVVAPVRDLMYQWHRRILAGLGYDAGVIGDNNFRVRSVSVTTYDSAYIHAARLGNRFELIVFDECHHLPGEMRRDAARMSAAPLRLGLTATLDRADGRHSDLGWLIGPTVYELPLQEVRGRTLADYNVVRIPVHLTDDERQRYGALAEQVRTYMSERRKDDPAFTWEKLCQATNADPAARRALAAFRTKQAIEDRAEEKLRTLEDLFRLHVGEPVIVFAGSNAMAREVSRRFLIPCLLNHCGKRERLDVLEGLEAGDYPALVANQVLDEGVDLPEVKVAIVIGGSASPRQAKQRLGRVLRRSRFGDATLYEIVTADTGETKRSRNRRKSDAYVNKRKR